MPGRVFACLELCLPQEEEFSARRLESYMVLVLVITGYRRSYLKEGSIPLGTALDMDILGFSAGLGSIDFRLKSSKFVSQTETLSGGLDAADTTPAISLLSQISAHLDFRVMRFTVITKQYLRHRKLQ